MNGEPYRCLVTTVSSVQRRVRYAPRINRAKTVQYLGNAGAERPQAGHCPLYVETTAGRGG